MFCLFIGWWRIPRRIPRCPCTTWRNIIRHSPGRRRRAELQVRPQRQRWALRRVPVWSTRLLPKSLKTKNKRQAIIHNSRRRITRRFLLKLIFRGKGKDRFTLHQSLFSTISSCCCCFFFVPVQTINHPYTVFPPDTLRVSSERMMGIRKKRKRVKINNVNKEKRNPLRSEEKSDGNMTAAESWTQFFSSYLFV